jgi:hypothetical protein
MVPFSVNSLSQIAVLLFALYNFELRSIKKPIKSHLSKKGLLVKTGSMVPFKIGIVWIGSTLAGRGGYLAQIKLKI